jgi:hypothetical protein
MTDSDEDHDRSRRSGAENRGWSHRSDTRWSDDQAVGDIMCGLYRAREDNERMFLS